MLIQQTEQLSLKEPSTDDLSTASTATLPDDRSMHGSATFAAEGTRLSNSGRLPDIKEAFTTAAEAIKVGTLVQDGDFTLHDAVGALEIMDPKMDSGLLADGENLEDDYDVSRVLSIEEVIGVMDQLLCFEMAWHQGFPLSRTVLSSHYIERLLSPRPETLEEATFHRNVEAQANNGLVDVVLRAYCLALVKTCSCVLGQMASERHWEEEDFVTQTYHRDLLSELDLNTVINLVEEAIMYNESLSALPKSDEGSAVECRLEMRLRMLLAVGRRMVDTNAPENWAAIRSLDLKDIEDSHALAKPVPEAYSQKLQRRLETTMPPKPLVKISFNEAIATLENLAGNGAGVYDIRATDANENILKFVQLFNAKYPQPPMFIRSLMQTLIWHDNAVLGRTSLKDFVYNDLHMSVLPLSNLLDQMNDEIEVPHDPRFMISKTMNAFAKAVADPYIDLFVIFCMNRSRVHRMLCHSIRIWDQLQRQAKQTDVELRQYSDSQICVGSGEESHVFCPLETWAKRHKIRQMMWNIQLGFELDLYQPDELSGMYWLLAHTTNVYIRLLIDTRSFTRQRKGATPVHQRYKKIGLNESLILLEGELLEARAVQYFAIGLSNLYAFLNHVGHIADPFSSASHSEPNLRYKLRVKAFVGINDPPCPDLDRIRELVTLRSHHGERLSRGVVECLKAGPASQALGILAIATEELAKAKNAWAGLSKMDFTETIDKQDEIRCKDFKNILKACIAANVAAAEAGKSMEHAGKTILSGLFESKIAKSEGAHHPWWIVPKIKGDPQLK